MNAFQISTEKKTSSPPSETVSSLLRPLCRARMHRTESLDLRVDAGVFFDVGVGVRNARVKSESRNPKSGSLVRDEQGGFVHVPDDPAIAGRW